MRIFLSAILLILSCNTAMADWAGSVKIKKIYTNALGEVWIKTREQPPNTCSYLSWYFKFDGTTEGGKNMLSTLLAAYTSEIPQTFKTSRFKPKVGILYQPSLTPGTDENSGCEAATLAVVDAIALK